MGEDTVRSFCPRCGATLRRGRPCGAWCDPCIRAGAEQRVLFTGYVPPSWRAAVADYDFGPLFREIRGQTGWSQHTLGGMVGLAQSQVSQLERGTSRLTHARLISGVAQGLRIPGRMLGFPDHP